MFRKGVPYIRRSIHGSARDSTKVKANSLRHTNELHSGCCLSAVILGVHTHFAAVASKHDVTHAATSRTPPTIAMAKPKRSRMVSMTTTRDSIKSVEITKGVILMHSTRTSGDLESQRWIKASLGSGNPSTRRGMDIAGRPSQDEPAEICDGTEALPKTPINDSSRVKWSSLTMPELPTNARFPTEETPSTTFPPLSSNSASNTSSAKNDPSSAWRSDGSAMIVDASTPRPTRAPSNRSHIGVRRLA